MKLNTIQYIILILLIGSVNLFSSCKDDDGHDAGSPVVAIERRTAATAFLSD